MKRPDYSALISLVARELGRRGGKVGGRACVKTKGFGSGDNARRAALARWRKRDQGK